jgi:hypothetical protein
MHKFQEIISTFDFLLLACVLEAQVNILLFILMLKSLVNIYLIKTKTTNISSLKFKI